MPISTSAKRFSRVTGVAGCARSRSISRKLPPPEAEQHQEHRDLGADHHAVGGAVEPRPVADIGQGSWSAPLARMQATPTIDMREKRAPITRQAAASARDAAPPRSRECRRSRSPRRTGAGSSPAAAACGDRAAPRRGWSAWPPPDRWPPARSSGVMRRALAQREQRERDQRGGRDLHQTGDREAGAQHVGDRQIDRADQHGATAAPPLPPRTATSASALQAAIGDAGRARCSARRSRAGATIGRSSRARNSTPPSVIDCAAMVRPWMTMDR